MNSSPKSTPEEPDKGSGSDAELSSHESIEQLHQQLAPQLERLAWSILRDWSLAADAVQESFGLLTQRIDDIPAENRGGWLIRTVQFQSQNMRRRQQRSSGIKLADVAIREATTAQKLPEEIAEFQEDLRRIRGLIDQLPEAQKLIVHRRLGAGQGFAEIASELDLPLGTVLSRMRLALKKLRTGLGENEDGD